MAHEDSQQYWLAIYVYDICTSCGTITKVEAKDASTYESWVTGESLGFPLWAWDDVETNHGSQAWKAPINLRITNSDGETLEFSSALSGVNSGATGTGSTNFCRSSATPQPTTSAPTTLNPTRSPLQPGETYGPTVSPTTSAPTTENPTIDVKESNGVNGFVLNGYLIISMVLFIIFDIY